MCYLFNFANNYEARNNLNNLKNTNNSVNSVDSMEDKNVKNVTINVGNDGNIIKNIDKNDGNMIKNLDKKSEISLQDVIGREVIATLTREKRTAQSAGS